MYSIYSKKNLKKSEALKEIISTLERYYWPQALEIFYEKWNEYIVVKDILKHMKSKADTYYPLECFPQIKKLSHTYNFPERIDENFLWKLRTSKVFLLPWWIYDILLDLNPKLKKIKTKNNKHKFALLEWIASRFPVDDIKYFIEILDIYADNENNLNIRFDKYVKDNKKLCLVIEQNKNNISLICHKNNNELIEDLSKDWYDTLQSFKNYEDYLLQLDDFQNNKKIATHYENLFKEIESFYYDKITVFSFFMQRDELDIMNYSAFAFYFIKKIVFQTYIDKNGNGHDFSYAISADTVLKICNPLLV